MFCIVTWLWAGQRRVRGSAPGRSTQTHNQWTPDALLRGVKQPGREFDHSPSSSAEAGNEWISNSMACDGQPHLN